MKNKISPFLAAASLSFLFAGVALGAGDPDVSGVFFGKTNILLQTGTAVPVEDGSNPFDFIAQVQSSGTGSISSAAFTPPGKSSIAMPASNGNFFYSQSFGTQAAMDAALPNGAYNFVIHTTDMPGGFDPSGTITGNLYPNTPQVQNAFVDGNLFVTASQSYTLNWNSYNNFLSNSTPGNPYSQIYVTIQDGSFNNVFAPPTFFTGTTSVIIPAGTLQANKTYHGSVTFGEGTAPGDGVTALSTQYNVTTNFTIVTPTGGVSPDFFAGKAALYLQNGTSAPVPSGSLPYGVFSLLEAAEPNSIFSGTLTPPAGSPGGSLTYENTQEGFGNFEAQSGSGTGATFSSIAAMNASYLDGTYAINGVAASGDFSANLLLNGTFSPNVLTITNPDWHGGSLAISPYSATTLTWKPLSDATASDVIWVQVFTSGSSGQDVLQATVIPATSGSFTLPVLAEGSYSVSISYAKVSGTSASIAGATGYAGFANHTTFNIVSKPQFILWQNVSSGEILLWFMNGTTFVSSQVISPSVNTNWQVVGAADFAGDGATDILWRNNSTGQNLIWIDGNPSSTVSLPTVANTSWQIVGVADFNGDGSPDILWRNNSTGQNLIWLMSGTTFSSSVSLPTVANTSWQIEGEGDFNGDGSPDILWRNSSTGQNLVWFMNGTSFLSSQALSTVASTAWQIAGTADFNGDGKPDILWRNYSTGQNLVWFMNGTTFVSSTPVTTVANTAWKIRGAQ